MENLVGLGKKMRCGSPCALVVGVARFALDLRNFPCQLLAEKVPCDRLESLAAASTAPDECPAQSSAQPLGEPALETSPILDE
jgi:hypothetical protein